MFYCLLRFAHCSLQKKMPIANDIVGKWNFVSSENFDEYLKAVGVGWAVRTIATKTKPTLDFVIEGDEWRMTSTSTFKTFTLKFKLGVPFDDKTADGRDTGNVVTVENDRLIHVETGKNGGADSRIERYIENGKLIIVCSSGSAKSTRVYEKAA
ncbi:unnamed protein product [Caenorhabditis angaria]|uniref:Cytosolic fatty-acid binding proteins domain-containing protein n=1 Tax=Caenorhabditis angaria TaxID=860376 RepID=A0A9P1N981_9PELO|nr:unnamed protein product [Caenorhabditis angaria]